eukprot:TRINITY_DN1010_c0_g1_i1.p1 TRINITY_DN1010_c0_g1~~TRINITY_DN1010_c0_g1_i1.p1  ORF type:complete len:969 (+),score=222.02 TRINITY_DN1010_c0_g1_i1:132-3038(+)
MFFDQYIYNASTAEVSNDTHSENFMFTPPQTPSINGVDSSSPRSLPGQSNIGLLKLANQLNARFAKPNSANFELPKQENSFLSQNIKQSDYSSSFLFKSQQPNLFQQEKKALLELKPVAGLFNNDLNAKIQENILKAKLKRAAEEELENPSPAKKFKAEDRTPIKINIQPVNFLPQSPKPSPFSIPASPAPMEFSIDDQMNVEIEKLMQDSSVFENAPSIYDISQAPRGAQQQQQQNINNSLNSSQDQVVNDAHIEKLLESLRRASEQVLLEQEPSPLLITTMRSYQKQALAWMIHREQSENNSMFNYDPSLIDADQHHCRSLPVHWREMTTSQGKKYYYNEVTKQTTWKFPYDAVAAQLDENNNQAKAVVRGGILADEMGMGKTLEMLSLVVSNPLNLEDSSQRSGSYIPSKTTLIICPLSVLHQWYSEIKRHTQKDSISVYIYHGANRRGDLNYLTQFDIVLTTYATLATEFPSQGKQAKGKKADLEAPIPHEKKGPILQVPWYRVILDEAQTIKDRTTRTARAAFCLQAERHWCVTGTPIQNKLDDLFSLLHFLRVRPYGEHNWWNQIIMKPIRNRDERGFTRLQTILQTIMLRRTKDQQINNQPIVSLPPRNVAMHVCDFSDQEREFYKQLWDSSKSKFDELFTNGTVLNNYAHILEILLRLRQACDHPQLVVESRLKTKRRLEQAAEDASSEVSAPAEAQQSQEESTQVAAPVQDAAFEDVLSYFDLDMQLGLEEENAVLNNENNVLQNENNVLQNDNVLNHDNVLNNEPVLQNESSIIQADGRSRSAKIEALTSQLKELYYGANAQPSDKCIIFSQWTSMLDMLEEPLAQLGLKFCRLDGAMAQHQREQAVKDFNSKPEIQLFLISMKAGGLGLNLVSANRVFLLDPWWNPSTEEQAIDRVHRIGQTKTVYVTRFVVKDTIEERILELQEKKKMLSQGALGMKKNELRQIRIDELKLLFRDN